MTKGKRIINMALTTVLTVLAFSVVMPQKVKADYKSGFYEYTVSNNKVTITGYTGAEKSVVIPSKIDNKPVVALGNHVFKDNKYIQTVKIPSTVTTIGFKGGFVGAFQNCENLVSITGAENVSMIGHATFSGSEKFTSYPFTNNLREIYSFAFSGSGISSVTFNSNMDLIDSLAFHECKNLTSVSIPTGVKEVEDRVFEDCVGLKKVTVGAVDLQDGCFNGCKNLESASFAEGVSRVAGSTFEGDVKLTSVKLPSSLRVIGVSAFSGCTSLTAIDIPYGVIEIGSYGFSESGLKNVVIPNSVVDMDGGVFDQCKSLESITIPKSVTKYGNYTFYKRTTVICYAGTKAEEVAKKNGNPIQYLKDIPATSIKLSGGPTIYLTVDDTYTIKCTTAPSNNNDAVVWESSKDEICSVNGMGELVAKKVGSVNIIATTTSGEYETLTVVVSNKPSSVTFDISNKEMLKGETFTKKAVVKDKVGIRNDVIPTYESSNTAVATVNKNGTVTAVGAGTATITAKTADLKASYTVKVYANLDKVKILSVKNVKGKKVTAKWKKVPLATGYELQYSKASSFKGKKTVNIGKGTTLSKTIKKLKIKKKYYIRVRAKAKVNGKNIYGDWSTKKKVKIVK